MSSETSKQAVLAVIDEATGRKNQVHRVLAQGDLVVTHVLAGTEFVFHDLFRVADGRAAEHWDVLGPR